MIYKTKRIVLICIAAIYAFSETIFFTLYQLGSLNIYLSLTVTTLGSLLTIPIIIMIWILVGLIAEPKYHKIKIALQIYAILATIFLIGALIFRK